MIFSRQRSGAGRHTPGRHAANGQAPAAGRDGANAPAASDAQAKGPGEGPFDVTEVPDDGLPRLDLGALLIPAVDGVELRVQAAPGGQVQQIMLVDGDSSLHVGAFAAPRTEGVWDEIRAEITQSLAADGGRATETDGPYGPQLHAQLPNGAHLRYVGIDGPRWFVRAVFQGAAALDPEASPRLALVLGGLVIVRGDQAMPVREPLPLRLPKEMMAHMEANPQQAGGETPRG
ncbi:DUF3710 domain-containing protein [Luedemannella helvata]|uniref:DUF3710 domain-containing protein n=1 Tax=Luedemannella helvata TaxID=349315 RepID=A0ABP4X922_9ACTN